MDEALEGVSCRIIPCLLKNRTGDGRDSRLKQAGDLPGNDDLPLSLIHILEFPQTTGYSVRNLKYMAKFAQLFPDAEFVQASLAQITWYHNIALMDKVKDTDAYLWYAVQTAKNGWSRNVLVHQIESGLYQRQALAEKISNFERRLPSPQSELAVQTMKDPYIFDFRCV